MNLLYFLLVIIVVLVVVFLFQELRLKKIRSIINKQCAKRKGKLIKGGLMSYPRVRFEHQGFEITVFSSPGGRNTPPKTFAQAPLALDKDVSLVIYRELALTKFDKFMGMQDIQIDNPDFDAAFIIKGNDEAFVQMLLSPEVRGNLLDLKDLNPDIRLKTDQLRISMEHIPDNDADCDAFIELSFTIAERLKECI